MRSGGGAAAPPPLDRMPQRATVVVAVALLSARFGSGWLAKTRAASVRVPGLVGVTTIETVADEPLAIVPASQLSGPSLVPRPWRVPGAPPALPDPALPGRP